MFLSLSDPTVSVPIYLLLLNLFFIFPLCCPHSLHCLTWSSPHSTIKSCCPQGDFSTLGTTAGPRLCLAPRSFPSWPHRCCEKLMQGRWHLWHQHLQVNDWIELIFLLLLLHGWYFVLDKLFWDECACVILYIQYYFHMFSFYLLPWSLLSFSFHSVVPAHKLSLWNGIYLDRKRFLCHEYYKESQADLPVFCYPELRAFSGTLH